MSKLDNTLHLLSALISVPSFSRKEEGTRKVLEEYLSNAGCEVHTEGNNVYAISKFYNADIPTLLLNSHHDTVKPNAGYTLDPFEAKITDGKLFGLGSNDAGASLVCLLQTFLTYHDRDNLPFNLVFAASAEEEISGKNGIERLLQVLPSIDFGIVGEPTSGEAAVAEKGLLVLDCTTHGKAGHAARNEGENALYMAMEDIQWFRSFEFPRTSQFLGPIHMNVTIIQSGSQHNVVPDSCTYTADIRTTDAYTLEETLEIIRENVKAEVVPRSVRLRPSYIEGTHPLRQAAAALHIPTYGSPTLSDQALMPFPTLKLGPGDSARSHTANEFVYVAQIENGLRQYAEIIEELIHHL